MKSQGTQFRYKNARGKAFDYLVQSYDQNGQAYLDLGQPRHM